MNGKPRVFDFDPSVSRAVAIDIIKAALDDEDLRLAEPDNGTHSGITVVLIDGFKRVIVPLSRIGPK